VNDEAEEDEDEEDGDYNADDQRSGDEADVDGADDDGSDGDASDEAEGSTFIFLFISPSVTQLHLQRVTVTRTHFVVVYVF
jgi:hypothetical protein